MKGITLVFLFLFMMFCCKAQKCKFDSIVNASNGTTVYYSKNYGNYQSGNNNMLMYFYKAGNDYYIKGSYTRFMSKDFRLNASNPFVICFQNGKDIILYPQDGSDSKSDGFNVISTLESWNKTCDVLYKIEKEQLLFLVNNVPSQIKVYITSEKINVKNTDSLGQFENLNYKIKYWHKKVVSAVQCILTLK